MKFMSWSLNEPSAFYFDRYAVEESEGQWKIVDPNAYLNWPSKQKNFWTAILQHHDKITSFGLQDFGVNRNGFIYEYGDGTDLTLVLNQDETKVVMWMRRSLRYLVDHYPNIEWFMQFVCMGPDRLNPLLDNAIAENGIRTQDNFIRQAAKVVDLYMERFPNRIKGIEIDFEKSSSRGREFREAEKYRDILKRVKDEICIPRGLKLRVTLHAMTGDFDPYWYQWTDYRTIANGRDKNGKMICDEWQIMSYDFAAGNTAPGPSTPVWWLRNVLNHATNVFPPGLVWVGNAAYGRRWSLDSGITRGVALTYAELLQWQNGLNKHNIGRVNGVFTWVDQNYIPFTGFHDDESGYQRTLLHCYDRFEVNFAKAEGPFNGAGVINRGVYNQTDFITSYSKHQRPIFEGIQVIKTDADSVSGNVTKGERKWKPSDTFPNREFTSYLVGRKTYKADLDNKVCVVDKEEGKVTYNINLPKAGRFRLIAAVRFPYLNGEIPIKLNGQDYVIGRDAPGWYPLMVNPERHFYDCGEWDFNESNVIEVGAVKDTAQIMGFIVCEGFKHNLTGGMVSYDVNLQPFKRRKEVVNGVVTKTDAAMPKNMTLTAELLRRPPRPAILWEDMFAPFLSSPDPIENLAQTRYYQRATITDGGSYSGPIYDGGRCTSPPEPVGYSSGTWKPQTDGTAHAYCDARNTAHQLVLYRNLSFSPHVEADLAALDSGKVGIRFFAHEEGTSNNGYLFLIDFSRRKYQLIYQSNGKSTVIAEESASLQVGSRYTFRARMVNNDIRCMVGSSTVIDYRENVNDYPWDDEKNPWTNENVRNYVRPLPARISRGAHGVYAEGARVKCYRIHVATNDRYEPMEKVSAIVDGKEHFALEEKRPYSYDEFGYLIYKGFDPDDQLGISIDNDYDNLPIATVPSWTGEKKVQLRMVDAGVWLRRFYVGDSKGYSIAWNGDLQSFINTSKMVDDYGCKGIAMWTIGQEDPRVFTYLPSLNE